VIPLAAVRGLKLQNKNWRRDGEWGKNLQREDERRWLRSCQMWAAVPDIRFNCN
jgi:hypothetical protein